MSDRLNALFQEVLHRSLSREDVDFDSLIEEHAELSDAEQRELRGFVSLLHDPLLSEPAPAVSRLGPYRVERELGRGGQALVYLAVDERHDRTVALKVLDRPVHALVPNWRGAERLRREADVASALEHPGICPVYETGEIEGLPFIAMRYVPGESLAGRIRRAREIGREEARLTTDDAVALVEDAARALHVAHEAGVVHRDVKPGNILIDRGDRPVLVDFGLARGGEADETLTRPGHVSGSPAYMSPEQTRAGSAELDPRTDVYSLGVTLYEALVLERPFRAPTHDLLFEEIRSAPFPDPRERRPELPADLSVVLETAMERDLDRRYRTALDLAEELRRVRESEPIRARTAGPLLRLERWARRRPALAVTLPTAALVLAGGLALSLWALRAERRANLRLESAVLAAGSSVALSEDPSKALRLAVDAARLERNFGSESALHAALDELHELRTHVFEGDQLHHAEVDPSSLRAAVTTPSGGFVFDFGTWEEVLQAPDVRPGRAIALAPGGERVAVCHREGMLRVLAVGSREEELVLTDATYQQVAFHPDGRLLACAPGARLALLPADFAGDPVELDPPPEVVRRFTFAESAERVFGFGGAVYVWHATTGALLGVGAHEGVTEVIAEGLAVEGGRGFVAIGPRSGVTLWDVESMTPRYRDASSEAVGGSLSQDGELLAVGYLDGSIRLLRAADGELLERIFAHEDQLRPISFSPDGAWLFSGCYDNSIRAGRPSAEGGFEILRGHEGVPLAVMLVGDRVFSIGSDRTAREWRLKSDGRERTIDLPARPVTTSFSPDGSRLLTGLGFSVIVHDRETREVIARTERSSVQLHGATWAPGGTEFLTADEAGMVRLWDAATGELGAVLDRADAPAWYAAMDPRGEHAAVSVEDGTLRVVSVADGTVRVLTGHGGGVRHAVYDPDGARIVSSSEEDASVRVWDAATGTQLARLELDGVRPVQACFSPDGQRVVVSSWDGVARIWSWRDEEVALELAGHEDAVRCAAYTPDGARVVTGSYDTTVRIWDARSAAPVATISPGLLDVYWVAIDPAGRWLVAATDAFALRLSALDPLAEAEERTARLSR